MLQSRIPISILTLFFTVLMAAPQSQATKRANLSVAPYNFCELTDQKVHCWGQTGEFRNANYRTEDPSTTNIIHLGNNLCRVSNRSVICNDVPIFSGFSNIKAFSSFEDKFCIITNTGLQCHGSFRFDWQTFAFTLDSPIDVAVGDAHLCVIDGPNVKCVGEKFTWRDLGQDTPPKRRFTNPRQITAGRLHTCLLNNSEVICWGDNRSGKLSPPDSTEFIQKISSGHNHTCFMTDKDISCWGENYADRLAVPDLKGPKELVTGSDTSCARDEEGIKCWGRNSTEFAISIAPTSSPAQSIHLGEGFSCLFNISSEGLCWGDTRFQLTSIPDIDEIQAGRHFVCIRQGHFIECHNNNSEVTGIERNAPFNSTGKLFAGENFACALFEGKAECWGENQNKQLYVPVDLTNIQSLALGGVHGCALTEDNKVRCWGAYTCDSRKRPCWGYNQMGELDVPANLSMVKQVVAGTAHTCALDENGVQCWGDNYWGQTDVPEDLGEVQSIYAKGELTCAMNGRQLKCWGNTYGFINQIELEADERFALGYGQYCTFGSAKGVQCWGDNRRAQCIAPQIM